MLVSTWKLAEIEGVTPQTIRRWVKAGKYKNVITTDGGHVRIEIENKKRRFIYARVSSSKQKSSIDKQIEIISKKYKEYEIISDIASAFNFQRKGLKRILECAMRGEAITVVVTTQDRLARSGFKLIKWIIELHGGEIITLEKSTSTEEFDTDELIGFITSFCNSHYGKSSARRKSDSLKEDKILS
jgi:putative resolvase